MAGGIFVVGSVPAGAPTRDPPKNETAEAMTAIATNPATSTSANPTAARAFTLVGPGWFQRPLDQPRHGTVGQATEPATAQEMVNASTSLDFC